MNIFKSLALTGALALGGTAGASAATLDFTDFSSYDFTSSIASGTFMGVDWTMTSNGGALTRNAGYDGAGTSKADMQTLTGLVEIVTVTFERSVKVAGVFLLDLFAGEVADIFVDGDLAGFILPTADANTTGGYAGFGPDAPVWLTSISFTPWAGSTKQGPDFALAGIEIAAGPLPAGGVLLLTALGGLGLAARRRKA